MSSGTPATTTPPCAFHLWGVTSRKILEALPFYSADSSGIMGTAYRYGRLRLFDPRTTRDVSILLNRTDPHKHRDLLALYGVTPGEIDHSDASNRTLLIRLSAASTQQFAAWLRKRRPITPPTWGINNAAPGPRVHVVAASGTSDYRALEPDDGPRIHLVDTAYDNMERL